MGPPSSSEPEPAPGGRDVKSHPMSGSILRGLFVSSTMPGFALGKRKGCIVSKSRIEVRWVDGVGERRQASFPGVEEARAFTHGLNELDMDWEVYRVTPFDFEDVREEGGNDEQG